MKHKQSRATSSCIIMSTQNSRESDHHQETLNPCWNVNDQFDIDHQHQQQAAEDMKGNPIEDSCHQSRNDDVLQHQTPGSVSDWASPPSTDENSLKTTSNEAEVSDSGREKLKRHRVEVAGRVWIPDIWGQEQLLKDWIDCVFDASVMKTSLLSARVALAAKGRRAHSAHLRIENSC